ncbi:MAG: GGDEF domain-containing protein [Myxococcota bacterium]
MNETLIQGLCAIAQCENARDAERLRRRLTQTVGQDESTLLPLLDALVARTAEVERLRHLAGTDSLTQVPNRRSFEAALEREISRHNRSASGLAVITLDLDGLKDINDRHGHAAGDEAICAVARACESRLRGSDLLARLGGDEFAVLLPMADRTTAELVAHRMRAAVEATQVRGQNLRVSIGIAAAGKFSTRAGDLLAEADRELYEEKAARHTLAAA